MATRLHLYCIASAAHVGLLQRAIDSAQSQMFRDMQMFVISADLTKLPVAASGVPVTLLRAPGAAYYDLYRAALQHLAAAAAGNPELCFGFWDADDSYHPSRLDLQMQAVAESNKPSFLTAAMIHFHETSEVFIVDLERRHQKQEHRIFWGTMIAKAAMLGDAGRISASPANPGHAVARHVFSRAGNDVHRTCGDIRLARIGVRGDNVSGFEHHRGVATGEKAWTGVHCRHKLEIVTEAIKGFPWDSDAVLLATRDEVVGQITHLPRYPQWFSPIGGPGGNVTRIVEKVD